MLQLLDHKNTKKTLDMALTGNAFQAMTVDAATASGLAFLQGELEKRDPKVREPLTSVTWMRDIVAKTGGGFVDWTSVMSVNYGTTGPNQYGIIGGQTTEIPVIQADLAKDLYPVFNWAQVLKVPYVDMQKANQVGRSLDDILDKGIRLNWNKALDYIVYNGYAGYGGLINHSSITSAYAATGASGLRTWVSKTPNEILYDINYALYITWANSEYDVSGMANTILIPPAQYSLLTQPMTIAGCASIMEYILKNNIARTQGVDLQILPCRQLISAGTGTTNRLLAYVNDEDRLYFDIPVPIQRAMTMPSVTDGAYLTLYVGQIGVPKFLFTQPAYYFDGI